MFWLDALREGCAHSYVVRAVDLGKDVPDLAGFEFSYVPMGWIPGSAVAEIRRFQGVAADEAATEEERYTATYELAARMIVSWNLKDPVTGDPLPIPAHNPQVIGDLPYRLQQIIMETLTSDLEIEIPLASENQS